MEAVSQSHMKAAPWEMVSRRCLPRCLEVDISGLANFSPGNKTGLNDHLYAGLMVYQENNESARYLLSGASAGRGEKLR